MKNGGSYEKARYNRDNYVFAGRIGYAGRILFSDDSIFQGKSL